MKEWFLFSLFTVLSISLYSQDAYHTTLQSTFEVRYTLPTGTWLFFDTEAAILDQASGYNGRFNIQESVDTDFSKIVLAEISSAGANAWDAGWNIRNNQPVQVLGMAQLGELCYGCYTSLY